MTAVVYPNEELITSFLREPKYDTFLVPYHYTQRVLAQLKAERFQPKRCLARSGYFDFDALQMRIAKKGAPPLTRLQEAIAILFGNGTELEVLTGLTGNRILPVVVPKEGNVTIDDDPQAGLSPEELERRARGIKAYTVILKRFAQLSGRNLMFHATKEAINPPYPDDGRIHILTHSCPPGETTARYIGRVFGMRIAWEQERIASHGPTNGRGVILKDPQGEEILQVVGENWYLLFPTLTHFNDGTSREIFERVLDLVWQKQRTGELKPAKPISRRRFMKGARTWTTGHIDEADSLIRQHQEDIEQRQKELIDLTRELKILIDLRESMGTGEFSRAFRQRLPQDLLRVKQHPLVARVDLLEDAIHVRTHPVVITHEGVTYPMVIYTIRVSKKGRIGIWSEGSTHPNGVPHPHIAKHGGHCFGNAATAITKAAGEARYGDTFEYILTWLPHGYTHAQAAVKIQEWPAAIPQKGGSNVA